MVGTTIIATTLADGSYWYTVPPTVTYTLSVAAPTGYTEVFDVIIPPDEITEPPTDPVVKPNYAPASVTVELAGATAVTPEDYLKQILPAPVNYPTTPYLPYYDGNDQRVEPPLNFGYVRADEAWLGWGRCEFAAGAAPVSLGTIKNGKLVTSYGEELAKLVDKAYILVVRNDTEVACGNVVVGAPTEFNDGRGSVARFRLLFRVSQSGQTALLPYYTFTDQERIAVNFLSMQEPITLTGPFGVTNEELALRPHVTGR